MSSEDTRVVFQMFLLEDRAVHSTCGSQQETGASALLGHSWARGHRSRTTPALGRAAPHGLMGLLSVLELLCASPLWNVPSPPCVGALSDLRKGSLVGRLWRSKRIKIWRRQPTFRIISLKTCWTVESTIPVPSACWRSPGVGLQMFLREAVQKNWQPIIVI